jgi:exopolysaccharide production protein ExoY
LVDLLSWETDNDVSNDTRPRKLRLYPIVKRAFDLTVVSMFAPAALLAVGALAAIVRMDGDSPFYRQPRVGLRGRTFMLWKLRTMVPDAEQKLEEYLNANPLARAEWNASQKLRHDPRITTIGQFLRKYSLDELPQLLNVFLGDMSLVGPRPMMPEQQKYYDGEAYYGLRPGLTGLWQIGKRNESTFAERAIIDTQYALRMSFVTDMWILSRTPIVVIKGTGI